MARPGAYFFTVDTMTRIRKVHGQPLKKKKKDTNKDKLLINLSVVNHVDPVA